MTLRLRNFWMCNYDDMIRSLVISREMMGMGFGKKEQVGQRWIMGKDKEKVSDWVVEC